MTERCACCRADRPLADLLIVVEIAEPHRHRFVCRPGAGGPDTGRCFRVNVRARDLERIETALPEPPLLVSAGTLWGTHTGDPTLERPRLPFSHEDPVSDEAIQARS